MVRFRFTLSDNHYVGHPMSTTDFFKRGAVSATLRIPHPREAYDPVLARLGKLVEAKEASLARSKDLYNLRLTALDEHDRETDILPAIT